MNDETSTVAGEAIGRRLKKVAASMHLFEGKMDEAPIDVWLFFEGLSPVRFFGAADGWRLSADRNPPEPMDMGEAGEVVVGDVSSKTALGAAVGERLEGAWLVKASTGDVFGVRFDFGLPAKPPIMNLDDELLVLDEYSSDAGADGFTEGRVRPAAMK